MQSSSRTPRAAAANHVRAIAIVVMMIACSGKRTPALTEPAAIEAAKIREEKLARIESVVRAELAGKKTRGEGATKQQQRDDEARRLKELRANVQQAIDAVTPEVGALGIRVTMLRPVPATPRLPDQDKETIGTAMVPPCVPDHVNLKTAVVEQSQIEYGAFKAKWATDAGTFGDDEYHPGIAVTRRLYFGEGQEVPLERSGAHVPADIELAIVACFLTDGTARPGPAR